MSLFVRRAKPADLTLVLTFVRELAEHERLAHEVVATEADISDVLFCERPRAFCEVVETDGEPVGFALWFYNLSTFLGRHGLFLEDLYVRPIARGRGAGKALLQHLACRCVEEGLGRLEWSVLRWNAPAQAFYDSLGALTLDEWVGRRVTGEALARLAGAA